MGTTIPQNCTNSYTGQTPVQGIPGYPQNIYPTQGYTQGTIPGGFNPSGIYPQNVYSQGGVQGTIPSFGNTFNPWLNLSSPSTPWLNGLPVNTLPFVSPTSFNSNPYQTQPWTPFNWLQNASFNPFTSVIPGGFIPSSFFPTSSFVPGSSFVPSFGVNPWNTIPANIFPGTFNSYPGTFTGTPTSSWNSTTLGCSPTTSYPGTFYPTNTYPSSTYPTSILNTITGSPTWQNVYPTGIPGTFPTCTTPWNSIPSTPWGITGGIVNSISNPFASLFHTSPVGTYAPISGFQPLNTVPTWNNVQPWFGTPGFNQPFNTTQYGYTQPYGVTQPWNQGIPGTGYVSSVTTQTDTAHNCGFAVTRDAA